MDSNELRRKLDELRSAAKEGGFDIDADLERIERRLGGQIAGGRTMDRVKLARLIGRPTMLDYVERIFDDFLEFHGDRLVGDDPAMIGGIATLEGKPYTLIGQHRGRNIKETIYRKNGMAEPEGYRKALRLARQAEKFGRPVVVFIDTQGAYPGVSSEERGIGEAIARNLREFSTLRTPIIGFIIGEAESGGALGIGVCDEVWMLENAVYSVISPEGCASILLRDASKAAHAAELMKITAADLLGFGIVDGVIPEPAGGAQLDQERIAADIRGRIVEGIARLERLGPQELLARRFDKYCTIGAFDGGAKVQEGFLRRWLLES